MSKTVKEPLFWLLVMLIGFPQISETIYTPSLPQLADILHTSGNWMQASLSIYFAGFAAGVVLWGMLADYCGRKPALLYGIGMFILGSAGCLLSRTVPLFLISRFVQAAGAATGSIVTQTILRDCYTDGIGLAMPHCLSGALTAYGQTLGVSGALLGLYYYILIGLVTGGMSWLHSENAGVMPLFFCVLSLMMIALYAVPRLYSNIFLTKH